jgi:hypothetical protein
MVENLGCPYLNEVVQVGCMLVCWVYAGLKDLVMLPTRGTAMILHVLIALVAGRLKAVEIHYYEAT